LEKNITNEAMQKVAAEMNLSETAFVMPKVFREKSDFAKEKDFELRWFSPTTEVPLCGHATLAAAAALFYCASNQNVKNMAVRHRLMVIHRRIHCTLIPK